MRLQETKAPARGLDPATGAMSRCLRNPNSREGNPSTNSPQRSPDAIRAARRRDRLARGVIGVLDVEITYDQARGLWRRGLLPYESLEDRDALSGALHCLLAEIGEVRHGSR